MITPSNRDPAIVQNAIACFFAKKRGGNWPLSITESARAIRSRNPHLNLTDSELLSMVAEYAVGQGLNVHFDRKLAARRH